MNPRTAFVAALALLAIASSVVAESFQARVVDVTAGDILQIEQKGKKQLVVLYGVVAGPSPLAAKESKKFAMEKVLNQTVTVRIVDRKLGMTLVELTLADGSNLGQVMLRNGLVRWDSLSATKDQGLKDLEKLAKQERLGLWRSLSEDQSPAASAASGKDKAKTAPHGADEKNYDRRVHAGYDILEGRAWKNEKGVPSMLLRGNGQKIPGFEASVEKRVIDEHEAWLAEQDRLEQEAAAAQAEADRLAYEEQQRMDEEANRQAQLQTLQQLNQQLMFGGQSHWYSSVGPR